ncbi:MAG: L-lysine 6-transaminase [Chloroflexota bacterium]
MATDFYAGYKSKYKVAADNAIDELSKHMLTDGFNFVLDLEKSNDSYFFDARNGKKYLDFFTCFASMPIGMNHPKLLDEDFIKYLGWCALNKPSNSDVYSEEMATFVNTLFNVAVPDYFKYCFFIEGGALAVENALKTAFDWKVRKNRKRGMSRECGHKIIHFREAFHGRSGYTMSLTNTDINKIKKYPKWDWPRVTNPKLLFPINEERLEETIKQENQSIAEIKQALLDNPHDIAALIIEPIQGEGGDNHFRKEFLQELRRLADENEFLLIFDEIQTGVGITGKMWAHEHFGVQPDIMTFGKKMQVCGILVGDRIDDDPENVFRVSSRINSTWGGNLIDMVRATKYLEIIEEENLVENARVSGEYLLSRLNGMHEEFADVVKHSRGRGLFCAFDLPSKEFRSYFINKCFDVGLIILPCGESAVRFRPALNITKEKIDEGFEIIHDSLASTMKTRVL